MRLRFLCVLAIASAACTSSKPERSVGGDDGAAAAAPDVNPYGVPYPTDNIGAGARVGSRPGNRIANFKFLGYPEADRSRGLQPISLAAFFDPEGRKYKLIHIQATGVWCTICKQETEILVPLAPKLAERGVVWIVSLAEGASPTFPAEQKDVDNWISAFKSPFTHLLDPANKNLGLFYSALPWQSNIDAKTMEILTSRIGVHNGEQDILNDVDEWLMPK